MPRKHSGAPYSPARRALTSRISALESWARTADRPARTAAARAAFLDRFELQVDPDGTLPADERAKRADAARSAYFLRLAIRSAEVRAQRKAARSAGGSA